MITNLNPVCGVVPVADRYNYNMQWRLDGEELGLRIVFHEDGFHGDGLGNGSYAGGWTARLIRGNLGDSNRSPDAGELRFRVVTSKCVRDLHEAVRNLMAYAKQCGLWHPAAGVLEQTDEIFPVGTRVNGPAGHATVAPIADYGGGRGGVGGCFWDGEQLAPYVALWWDDHGIGCNYSDQLYPLETEFPVGQRVRRNRDARTAEVVSPATYISAQSLGERVFQSPHSGLFTYMGERYVACRWEHTNNVGAFAASDATIL